MLRLAVPSDGALHEPSLLFLESSGMGVSRRNLRRYTAEIPSLPGVAVHFQRGSDIALKVEEGSAELGLVGLDRFLESRREGGGSRVVIEGLGFGHAELVLGVPDSWVDVSSLADLADLAVDFRAKGTDLRIATKYPRLVERFLLSHGVAFFTLVPSSGTLEAAPEMGYADIIADISSTGTTMRANRLKTIAGGSVVASEACLIGNGPLLAADPEKLRLATAVVERIEGRMRSLDFYTITANMKGEDPDSLAAYVLKHDDISGLTGPTISKVYSGDGNGWFSVTVMVEKDKLLDAVDQFRELGGSSVTVSQPDYVFHSECSAVERLTSAQ
jgi:ATP phosphoribosyltransferase